MSLIGKIVFFFIVYFLSVFWASIMCFKLFLDLIFHPVSFFQSPKKRSTPPQCLLDESLGKHEYIRANGIKFHYVTAGDKSKPLMLLLHGFPEVFKVLCTVSESCGKSSYNNLGQILFKQLLCLR